MKRDDTGPVRQIDLSASRHSARLARQFVREALDEWGYQHIEDAVTLTVTELVTNAVVHAHSAATVTLLDHRGGVQVRVQDEDPMAPELQSPTPDESGGRGMVLIDALSDQWGVEPAPPGKIVWLDITGDRPVAGYVPSPL